MPTPAAHKSDVRGSDGTARRRRDGAGGAADSALAGQGLGPEVLRRGDPWLKGSERVAAVRARAAPT